MKAILVVVLVLVSSVVLTNGQSCSISNQVNLYWNSACTSPSAPYCASLNAGQQCSQCISGKTNYPMCDCLGNTWCTPDQQNQDMNTCVQFPLNGTTCYQPTDCPQLAWVGTSTKVVGYWSCLNNKCVPCNQTAYPNPIVCPGGSPYPASSHAGVIVYCNANGYWQQNGTVSAGTTSGSPPSPPSPSTTTRSSTSSAAVALTTATVATTMMIVVLISLF
jgi:hypothetical protein